MPKVITISREYGAGGTTIGKAVAERLGIEFLDKALILTTAYEAQVDVESVYKLDENLPSGNLFTKGIMDFYNKPLNEKLFEAQSEVIKMYGERGNCLIVGRNANSIIREYDNTLHVFLYGNMAFRRNRMMKKSMYEGISEAKMTELINSMKDEWLIHNLCYHLNIKSSKTKSVDLNNKDSFIYDTEIKRLKGVKKEKKNRTEENNEKRREKIRQKGKDTKKKRKNDRIVIYFTKYHWGVGFLCISFFWGHFLFDDRQSDKQGICFF